MSAVPVSGAPLESQKSTNAELGYRADIDGLRAFAALAVVGAHVGLVPGGFVGVDVFFVISGYLISGLILRQLAQGRFHTIDFYARRARRIFPALIAVLVTVSGFGWLTLLTDEYRRLGQDVAEGAGFVLNLSQYWHSNSSLRLFWSGVPLGHLWSLGVEEQFYLLWPLFLLLTWKLGDRQFTLIVMGTVVSFILNIVVASQGPGAAYGLPWTRMWQLSLGGAFAYIQLDRFGESKRIRALFHQAPICWLGLQSHHFRGLIGAVLLIASCVGLNDPATFPGWLALVPSLGALLLISAGPRGWVNRWVLGTAPMVYIGLISYPLYLWHLPLLAIPRIVWLHVTSEMIAGAVAASLTLAFLTYRCIELPLRSFQNTTRIASILCTALLACGGMGYMISLQAVPARAEPLDVHRFIQAAAEDWLPGSRDISWTLVPDGFLSIGAGTRRVLYLGDSNMQQYYPRIAKVLSSHPLNRHGATFAVRDGCAPIAMEVPQSEAVASAACGKFVQAALEYAKDPAVDTIVISACWPCYFVHLEDLFNGSGRLIPDTDRALNSLKRTITDFVAAGKQVYLVLNIPIGADLDPHQMIRRTVFPPGFRLIFGAPKRTEVTEVVRPIASRLVEIAQATGANVIDPILSLCDRTTCQVVSSSGEPMYHDWWNLSPSYVRDNVLFLDGTVLDRDRVSERADGQNSSGL